MATYSGTSGDDSLVGGSEADFFDAGDGDDTLIGGGGADTYNISGKTGEFHDVIQGNGTVILDIDGVSSFHDFTLGPEQYISNNYYQTITFEDGSTLQFTSISQIEIGSSVYEKESGNLFINLDTNELFLPTGQNGGGSASYDPYLDNRTHSLFLEISEIQPDYDIFYEFRLLTDYDDNSWTVYGSSEQDSLVVPDITSGIDVTFYGYGGNDIFTGYDGDDAINGGDGNDRLSGGSGSDILIGGNGDDVLHVRGEYLGIASEADTLLGGDGNDTITGALNNGIRLSWLDSINSFDGGDGEDTIILTLSDGETFSLSSTSNIDNFEHAGIDLSSDGDNVTLEGDAGDNTLTAYLTSTDGTFTLSGNSGDDTLTAGRISSSDISTLYLDGGDGNDLLQAEAGDDTLDGGTGNDTLEGNGGSDIFTGGDGADEFVLRFIDRTSDITDASIITDFEPGTDTLRLVGVAYDELTFSDGTGDQTGNTIITFTITEEIIAILEGVAADELDGLFAPHTSEEEVQLNGIEDTDIVVTYDSFAELFNGEAIVYSLQVTALPESGALLRAIGDYYAPINVNDVITKEDLEAGEIIFRPSGDEYGSEYTTFSIQPFDGLFYGNSATVSIDIEGINDAPLLVHSVATTVNASSLTISLSDIAYYDLENTIASIQVLSLPSQGSLTLNNVPVEVNQIIQSGDINSGLLVYTSEAGIIFQDQFDITASDGSLFSNNPAHIQLNGYEQYTPSVGENFNVSNSDNQIATSKTENGFIILTDNPDGDGISIYEYSNNGNLQNVETLEGLTGYYHTVSQISDGSFSVVWVEYDSGSPELKQQLFDEDWQPKTEELLIVRSSDGDNTQFQTPEIFVNSDESYTVIWSTFANGSTNPHFQTFHNDSEAVTAITELNRGSNASNQFTTTKTTNGYAVASTSDETVYLHLFDTNGDLLGDTIIVETSLGDVSKSNITQLADDRLVIAWNDQRTQDPETIDVNYRLYTGNGTPLTSVLTANPIASYINDEPAQITPLNDGGFLISWESQTFSDELYDENILVQRFSSNGEAIGSNFQVNTLSYDDQEEHYAVLLNNGKVLFGWTSEAFQNVDAAILTVPNIPVPNQAPRNLNLSSTRISENFEGAEVGTLSATDPEGGSISFSVSDDRFEVVGDSLKLKDDIFLDFETEDTVSITVRAIDDGGKSTSRSFNLTVIDTDEPITEMGSETDDTLSGGAVADLLSGGNGNDVIIAAAGNDTLSGGNGDDNLDGGDDDDLIEGGEGNDNLIGGNGNDLLRGGNGSDNLNAGNGDDNVWAGAQDDSNDTLNGGSGQDQMGAGFGDDYMDGEDGNDTLYASAGNDTINGGDGDDLLFNGDGDDTINGGSGNDTIWGCAGNDTITSGAGNDTFIFATNIGQDIITDFSLANDTLDFSSLGRGFSDVSDVIAASSAVTVNGESGVLIDFGEGESLFLAGLSLNDMNNLAIEF